MDMWRRPKIYAERLAAIQQEDVLLPSTPARNVVSGADVELEVAVLALQRQGCARRHRSDWSTTSGRKAELPVVQAVDAGSVDLLGTLELTMPKVDRATLRAGHDSS